MYVEGNCAIGARFCKLFCIEKSWKYGICIQKSAPQARRKIGYFCIKNRKIPCKLKISVAWSAHPQPGETRWTRFQFTTPLWTLFPRKIRNSIFRSATSGIWIVLEMALGGQPALASPLQSIACRIWSRFSVNLSPKCWFGSQKARMSPKSKYFSKRF